MIRVKYVGKFIIYYRESKMHYNSESAGWVYSLSDADLNLEFLATLTC